MKSCLALLLLTSCANQVVDNEPPEVDPDIAAAMIDAVCQSQASNESLLPSYLGDGTE